MDLVMVKFPTPLIPAVIILSCHFLKISWGDGRWQDAIIVIIKICKNLTIKAGWDWDFSL